MNQSPIPKFSIIIPTYNSGSTLTIALESIVLQSYQNFEVLIIDGESNDNTKEIVSQFQKQIPRLYFLSEKDKGIYDAMNKGIDLAKGDWLFFMGSDDSFYDASVLEKVALAIQNSKAKVLYGNVKISGDTGWAVNGQVYDGPFDVHKLLKQNICHQAIFYDTKFIKGKVGYFNLAYKKSSDWDFNLRCWAQQPFEFVDLIIANFIAGGFSTHSNDIRIREDFLNNVLAYFKINPFHPLVNNPTFTFYAKVLKMQREKYPWRYKWNHFFKRIQKKLIH